MLRRGPLLGPVLQHPDDVDVVRCLFLYASLSDSLRMITPSLWLVGTDSLLHPIAPVTLALQSEFVLLFDHHTELMIW